MIEQIKEHFEKEYPREGCGIIGIVKGKKRWFPCKNTASSTENFSMCSHDYWNVKKQADIFAIVHSHPDSSNEASPYDIECCNALGIPYYIFSYPDMKLNIVEPVKRTFPLIGRDYVFGAADCFEAARDWLKSEGIEIPPREPFQDNWWDKELNYFTEEALAKWGFKKVSSPQKNDILIFQMQHSVPDHCGVYLGNDIFFHHAENRISCRESLYPLWRKHIVGIYRYEA